MFAVYSLLIGFAIDALIGDPRRIPHPVCLIGKLISGTEKVLRKISCKTPKSRFVCGTIETVVVLLLSFSVPFIILFVSSKISVYLFVTIQSIMCWQIIAARSLKTESMKVYYELKNNSLEGARQKLSWIVGRDTRSLDRAHVTRAAVETVAENTSDGVTAPIFYILIGGAPLGFLYKAVNTLDSMIGYKNEKYIDFGKFAARLDDVANFIPSRITGLIMILASFFALLDVRNAARIFFRDRKNHQSPNSACTESACAGALRVELAGDSFYFGKLVKKPTIGDDLRAIEPEDIKRANRLMYITSLLFMVIGIGARFLILILIRNIE